MKKWLTWLKNRNKDWPILISLIVASLNIELVVAPHILNGIFGLTGDNLRLSAGMWSSVEMFWWVFFSGWLFKEKIRKLSAVSEAIDLGHEAIDKFDIREILKPKPNDPYLILKLKGLAQKHIEDFDLYNYQEDKTFLALFGFAKGLGYFFTCLFVVFIALLPLFWIFSLMICRLTGWRMAYFSLFLGNFIKNYFFAYIYELIGFWMLLLLFIAAVIIFGYMAKKVMKYV